MILDKNTMCSRTIRRISGALLMLVILQTYVKEVHAKVGDPCCKRRRCISPQETCIDNRCDCSSDYDRDETNPENIACKKKGVYGESCSETKPCKENVGLHYAGGTCYCIDDLKYYNPEEGKCVPQLRYGEECDPNLPNNTAQCYYYEDLRCIYKYEKFICGCVEGNFYFIDERRCFPRFGNGAGCNQFVSEEDWCQEGLSCMSKTDEYDYEWEEVCSCPDGQVYNEDEHRCQPKSSYGGPCDPFVIDEWCEEGTSCDLDEETQSWVCL